jgi:hypothetical protein
MCAFSQYASILQTRNQRPHCVSSQDIYSPPANRHNQHGRVPQRINILLSHVHDDFLTYFQTTNDAGSHTASTFSFQCQLRFTISKQTYMGAIRVSVYITTKTKSPTSQTSLTLKLIHSLLRSQPRTHACSRRVTKKPTCVRKTTELELIQGMKTSTTPNYVTNSCITQPKIRKPFFSIVRRANSGIEVDVNNCNSLH